MIDLHVVNSGICFSEKKTEAAERPGLLTVGSRPLRDVIVCGKLDLGRTTTSTEQILQTSTEPHTYQV